MEKLELFPLHTQRGGGGVFHQRCQPGGLPQLAAVLNEEVSQRRLVAGLVMSHQLSLVFIPLSVEWGLRAEGAAETEGWREGSSGCGQTRCHWGWTEDRRGREPL